MIKKFNDFISDIYESKVNSDVLGAYGGSDASSNLSGVKKSKFSPKKSDKKYGWMPKSKFKAKKVK